MPLSLYLPCDRFRRQSSLADDDWHVMMAERQPVTAERFAAECRLEDMLDDDETLRGLIADDPDAGFYESEIRGRRCLFLQRANIEFIFMGERDIRELSAFYRARPYAAPSPAKSKSPDSTPEP